MCGIARVVGMGRQKRDRRGRHAKDVDGEVVASGIFGEATHRWCSGG